MCYSLFFIMSFKDDLQADMDTFFNTNEFAVEAIWSGSGTPINVVFDQTSNNFDTGDVDVIQDRIEILTDQNKVQGIKTGDTITIAPNVYTVIEPDDQGETIATGFIRLILSLEGI